MQCDDIQLLISRELDGEITEQQRRNLGEHLAGCAECVAFQRRCRALQQAVHASPTPLPEGTDWDQPSLRWTAALARQERREGRRVRVLLVAACVAVAACVVVSAAHVRRSHRESELEARIAQLEAAARAAEKGAGWDLSLAALPARSPRDLREPVAAFAALGDYFGPELRWMATDGAQTELGITTEASSVAATHDDGVVAAEIRLERTVRDQEPQLISAPSLVIVPGSEANFRLAPTGTDGPKRLRYCCTLDVSDAGGGLLRVAVQVMPEGGDVPVLLSGMIDPDRPGAGPVAFTRQGDVGYVLYLSVRLTVPREPSGGQT